MKVLVNNYNKEDIEQIKTHKFTCENCSSELEYDESDITIGVYGAAHVRCPLCDYNNMIEDEEYDITLTKDNIEYPTHFYHTSKELGAVDICDNEHVKEAINDAIKYFRNNKDEDEYYWLTASGNMHVVVFRFEDEYDIVVTDNYYSTYIPFEQEDY